MSRRNVDRLVEDIVSRYLWALVDKVGVFRWIVEEDLVSWPVSICRRR
jgi:hypothetical protein